MIHKLDAIILSRYPFGDSSDVVKVFCAEFGRLSVMAKGSRSPKNKSGPVLQPLSIVELSLSLREGAEMATLREASPKESWPKLTEELERMALAALCVELAAASTVEHQHDAELFALAVETLRHLAVVEEFRAPLAAAVAMLRTLTLAGVAPQLSAELLRPWPADQGRPAQFTLDVHQGVVSLPEEYRTAREWPSTPSIHARHFPLPPSALRTMHLVQKGPAFPDDHRPPPEETEQLIEGLLRLAEEHLHAHLGSAKFWRELVGEG